MSAARGVGPHDPFQWVQLAPLEFPSIKQQLAWIAALGCYESFEADTEAQ